MDYIIIYSNYDKYNYQYLAQEGRAMVPCLTMITLNEFFYQILYQKPEPGIVIGKIRTNLFIISSGMIFDPHFNNNISPYPMEFDQIFYALAAYFNKIVLLKMKNKLP